MRRLSLLVLAWLVAVLVAAPARAGVALAVVAFDNHTGDPELTPLGRGLADMMVTDLAQVSSLRLVERSRLAEVLRELELGASDLVDPATAARAGRVLGASHILTGFLAEVSPTLRVDARVVAVDSGEVLATATVSGPRAEFFLLEKELVERILASLAVEVGAPERARVGRIATESWGAFEAWSRALDALDRDEVEAARRALQEALRADARFGAASQALDALGASLAASDVARDEALEQRVASVRAAIADVRSGKTEAAELGGIYAGAMGMLATAPWSVRRELARDLLGLDLPERVTIGGHPSGTPVTQYAMLEMVTASTVLGHRADALTWGRTFAERYPDSAFYPAVRSQVDRVMKKERTEIEAREALPEARAQAEQVGLAHACKTHPLPSPRADACEARLRGWIARPPPSGRDASLYDAWIGALLAAGRTADLSRVRAIAEEQHSEAGLLSVARAEERVARLPEAIERARAGVRSRRVNELDQGLSSTVSEGGAAELPALRKAAYKAFADQTRVASMLFALDLAVGDLDAAADDLVRLAAMPDGGPLTARLQPRLDSAYDRLAQVALAEGLAELALAEAERRSGLEADAARRFEAVVRRWPDSPLWSPSDKLLVAAQCWTVAMQPGGADEARRIYTELRATHSELRERIDASMSGLPR